jgi:hypothetical protein
MCRRRREGRRLGCLLPLVGLGALGTGRLHPRMHLDLEGSRFCRDSFFLSSFSSSAWLNICFRLALAFWWGIFSCKLEFYSVTQKSIGRYRRSIGHRGIFWGMCGQVLGIACIWADIRMSAWLSFFLIDTLISCRLISYISHGDFTSCSFHIVVYMHTYNLDFSFGKEHYIRHLEDSIVSCVPFRSMFI